MSNINHTLKTILIHNPKAAGTSIYLALGMDHSHDTLDDTRTKHAEFWPTYFKFAIVRNPFDRLISTYEFSQMDRSWYHDNISPGPAGRHGDAHVDYLTLKGRTFEESLAILLESPGCKPPGSLKQPGWLPQSHFIPDLSALDFLGRFERLEHDWLEICRNLGVDIPLPRVNTTTRSTDRRAYYTPFACEAAARIYRADFARFGYRLPIPFLPAAQSKSIDVPYTDTSPPQREPLTPGRVMHGIAGIAKAVTGTGGASEGLIQSRTAICKACEHWRDVGVGKCDLCGCATWAKVRNADENCPIAKW